MYNPSLFQIVPPESDSSGSRKQQLDYAWNWFALHANQRVSMLNFFLVGVGIILAAIATLLENHVFLPALILAVAGVLVCLIFFGLEWRNRKLVTVGEAMLVQLERIWLFKNLPPVNSESGGHDDFGILKWDARHYSEPKLKVPTIVGKRVTHKNLIPIAQGLFCTCFVFAVVYAGVGLKCAANLPHDAAAYQVTGCILTTMDKWQVVCTEEGEPDGGC